MQLNELKGGAILSYVSLILNNIIALVFTPWMLYYLGQAEYGLYSLIGTMVGYLTILDFGFGGAVIRYTAKYVAQNNEKMVASLCGMFYKLYWFISLLVFIFGIILTSQLDSFFGDSMSSDELYKAKFMSIVLVLNLALTFPLGIYNSLLVAYEKFIVPKLINTIRIILNPLVIILFLVYGHKATTMVIITALFNLVTLYLNKIYFRYSINIKFQYSHIDFAIVRDIIAFSFFAFLLAILDKFYYQFSPFILGSIYGTVSVSILSIALQMRTYFASFSGAISGVFLRRVVNMIDEKSTSKEITKFFVRISRLQFYIISLLFAGYLLVGKSFILLWVGPDYEESFECSLIIMFPFCIALIQNIYYPIMQAMDKQKYLVYVYVMIFLMVITGSYILIPLYSIKGAALAIGISSFLGEVCLKNIYFWKILGINVVEFWRSIFLPTVVNALLLITFKYLIPDINNWTTLGCIVVFFTLSFLVINYFILFNESEKDIVRNIWSKILVLNVKRI